MPSHTKVNKLHNDILWQAFFFNYDPSLIQFVFGYGYLGQYISGISAEYEYLFTYDDILWWENLDIAIIVLDENEDLLSENFKEIEIYEIKDIIKKTYRDMCPSHSLCDRARLDDMRRVMDSALAQLLTNGKLICGLCGDALVKSRFFKFKKIYH